MRGRILLVEDDHDVRALLNLKLSELDFHVVEVDSAEEALQRIPDGGFDAVLADHVLPARSGATLCAEVAQLRPELPVIMITGQNLLEVAIESLRAGAFDFLTKPLEVELVVRALDRAVETAGLRREVLRLQDDRDRRRDFPEILGESDAMRDVFHFLSKAALVDSSVLITGETGTGKELAARALHRGSRRAAGPFLAVNCAAVPEHLLESELFGHRRGAFTDAREDRKGLLVQADGGTLFLDEIGDMPLSLQAKLLRVFQDRRVRPLGAEEEVAFDVRIVAATNQDLTQAIAAGAFRRDLFYRLTVLEVELPPLRERERDILLLAQEFLREAAARLGREVEGFTPEAAARLLTAPWEGNVRELQNCVERAVVLGSTPQVQVLDLPAALREPLSETPARRPAAPRLESLQQLEARHIARVLAAVGGNKGKCARVLGINRTTLYRKLERYDIR